VPGGVEDTDTQDLSRRRRELHHDASCDSHRRDLLPVDRWRGASSASRLEDRRVERRASLEGPEEVRSVRSCGDERTGEGGPRQIRVLDMR